MYIWSLTEKKLEEYFIGDQNSVLDENKHFRMVEKGKVHFGQKQCPHAISVRYLHAILAIRYSRIGRYI